MTGSPQVDPRPDARVYEVAAELAYPRAVQDRHEEQARILLMRADAVDEASGVRRVTAQELADQLELAWQEERQRLADVILPDHWQTVEIWGGVQRLACGRCRHGDGVRFLWPCPTRRAITGEAEPESNSALLSADPPVESVS